LYEAKDLAKDAGEGNVLLYGGDEVSPRGVKAPEKRIRLLTEKKKRAIIRGRPAENEKKCHAADKLASKKNRGS